MLGDWTGQSTSELSEDEVARLTIEQGIIDSYRYVFGTIFWFVLKIILVLTRLKIVGFLAFNKNDGHKKATLRWLFYQPS